MFHAANELDDDEISVLDVEEIILTGSIIARQRDQQTRERKYVIRGATLAREAACCFVKIGPTRTRRPHHDVGRVVSARVLPQLRRALLHGRDAT